MNFFYENIWVGIHQGGVFRVGIFRGEFTGGGFTGWEFTGGEFTRGEFSGHARLIKNLSEIRKWICRSLFQLKQYSYPCLTTSWLYEDFFIFIFIFGVLRATFQQLSRLITGWRHLWLYKDFFDFWSVTSNISTIVQVICVRDKDSCLNNSNQIESKRL